MQVQKEYGKYAVHINNNPNIYPDLRAYYISAVYKLAFGARASIRDWNTTGWLFLTSVLKGPVLPRDFRSAVLGSAGLPPSRGMRLWKTLGVCVSPSLGVKPSDKRQMKSDSEIWSEKKTKNTFYGLSLVKRQCSPDLWRGPDRVVPGTSFF